VAVEFLLPFEVLSPLSRLDVFSLASTVGFTHGDWLPPYLRLGRMNVIRSGVVIVLPLQGDAGS
jgi:hypothetical protein